MTPSNSQKQIPRKLTNAALDDRLSRVESYIKAECRRHEIAAIALDEFHQKFNQERRSSPKSSR